MSSDLTVVGVVKFFQEGQKEFNRKISTKHNMFEALLLFVGSCREFRMQILDFADFRKLACDRIQGEKDNGYKKHLAGSSSWRDISVPAGCKSHNHIIKGIMEDVGSRGNGSLQKIQLRIRIFSQLLSFRNQCGFHVVSVLDHQHKARKHKSNRAEVERQLEVNPR